MKNMLLALTICLSAFLLVSCNDDETLTTDVQLSMISAKGLEGTLHHTVQNGTITLTNINTGVVIKQPLLTLVNLILNVDEGTYNIVVDATISYSTTITKRVKQGDEMVTVEEQKEVTQKVQGLKNNVICIGGQVQAKIELYIINDKAGFVISEIFFAGTQTPEGKQYGQDKYFEIYNNSDEILYADGLSIAECAFGTTWAKMYSNLTPDTRTTETAIQAFYRIPGNGTDYPVMPGTFIVLVDVAKDHRNDNPNSFDLSHADFEWYDDNERDIDIIEVPNMEKIYSYSRTVWAPHNRGYHSYILFKLDKSKEAFLQENIQTFTYKFQFKDIIRDITKEYYTIPNDLIIDAVELSAPSAYTWKALSPGLDLGWTHSGDSDNARYGNSVTRKVSHTNSDGNAVLIDTNNSTLDFEATSEASPACMMW